MYYITNFAGTIMPDRLLSDKPITSAEEDILGLGSFADALAKSLTEMAPDEGLVISVEGEWGSGKTSALRLTQRRVIIRELAREQNHSISDVEKLPWKSLISDWDALADNRHTHVVLFNPWNFSGQESLVRAFFREVGAVIDHPPGGQITRALDKLAEHLPNAGTIIGGLVAGMMTSGAAASAGATSGRAVGETARAFLSPSGSLETAKRELDDALIRSGKRVIVIIDDLDRLLPSKMRAMFSLVKSLGDLPNVLYVLSFDPIAVRSALAQGPEAIEPKFLEKIVQVPLKLPPPWEPEIRQFFFQQVDAIIGDATPNDQSRWQNAFFKVIAPYIRTPRDVTRFSNTLKVVWPNIASDVDLTDLIILITLQLFEPSVYESVYQNIELLAGESINFEDDKVFAERFVPSGAKVPETARKALAYLFPRLAKGWNELIQDGTPYIKKREQRRVCTKECYRNYFLFGCDPDRLSRSTVEAVLLSNSPTEHLRDLLKSLIDKTSRKNVSLVGILLDQIADIVFSKPLLSKAVIRAILDLSDELIEREDLAWEFFVEENIDRLDSILRLGLEPLRPEERADRARFMASYDLGLTLGATAIDRLAGQHGLYGGEERHESERLISREIAQETVSVVLARIRHAAREGALLSLPRPVRLLWVWRRWTNSEEVKSWIMEQLESNDAVLRLAEILPQKSYQSGGNGRQIVHVFNTETYREIIDIELFKERLELVAKSFGKDTKAEQIRLDS
jgi:predicted KAP-like P-loop ATPase